MPDRLNRAAWLVVGLLWVVALLNYLDRQLVVTMSQPIKADLRKSIGKEAGATVTIELIERIDD